MAMMIKVFLICLAVDESCACLVERIIKRVLNKLQGIVIHKKLQVMRVLPVSAADARHRAQRAIASQCRARLGVAA
jgi:hypothetical protein